MPPKGSVSYLLCSSQSTSFLLQPSSPFYLTHHFLLSTLLAHLGSMRLHAFDQHKISQALHEFDHPHHLFMLFSLLLPTRVCASLHLCELVSISLDLYEFESPFCLSMLYFRQSRRCGSPHPSYSCVYRRRLLPLLPPHPRPSLAMRAPSLLPAPSRRLPESPELLPSLSTSSQLLLVAPLL